MACMGEALEVFVASDHNGTAARNHVMQILREIAQERDLVPTDLGPDEYEGKVDYPDIALKMARSMMPGDGLNWCHGILICGTGSGMEIAANRFPWIRAAIATDKVTAQLMRQHNDANVLVLGQWRTPLGEMEEIIRAFLKTPWEGGRHVPRVEKLKRSVCSACGGTGNKRNPDGSRDGGTPGKEVCTDCNGKGLRDD